MKRRCVFALSCAPAVLVLLSPVQAQQYAPGFEWNRTANWVPGTTPGSTVGNPQPERRVPSLPMIALKAHAT